MTAPGGPSRCFGTDGIRDRAGEGLLSPEAVASWGAATGEFLRVARGVAAPRLVIVRDTRASGAGIEAQFVAGMRAGAECRLAGVLPGPAASVLTREGFDLGVVISASHNPAGDNGLKFFDPSGGKLAEADEVRLESLWHERTAAGGGPARSVPWPGARERYVARLSSRAPRGTPPGLRAVLDCANGAASGIAEEVLGGRGVQILPIASSPDGRNINDGCGAAHPERLAREVRETGADLGLALDGDGDRLVCADRTGAVRDGDDILVVVATCMKEGGMLVPPRVAGTVMTNIGVETYLRGIGVSLQRTPVGDRHVAEAMREGGLPLGGESSGHLVFGAWGPTGDGLVSAAYLLDALASSGADLAEWGGRWTRCPSAARSVRCRERPALETLARFSEALARARADLGTAGRVVARYSGTEPLLRILVEAPSATVVNRWAGALADAATRDLGTP